MSECVILPIIIVYSLNKINKAVLMGRISLWTPFFGCFDEGIRGMVGARQLIAMTMVSKGFFVYCLLRLFKGVLSVSKLER